MLTTFSSDVFLQKCQNWAWEWKRLVEINKPVSVVKHAEVWTIIFAKVVYEHTLGAVGSTYLILLEIYSGVTVPKIIQIGTHGTKLLQKRKGCIINIIKSRSKLSCLLLTFRQHQLPLSKWLPVPIFSARCRCCGEKWMDQKIDRNSQAGYSRTHDKQRCGDIYLVTPLRRTFLRNSDILRRKSEPEVISTKATDVAETSIINKKV